MCLNEQVAAYLDTYTKKNNVFVGRRSHISPIIWIFFFIQDQKIISPHKQK